eukprot:gene2146-18195_t
MRSACIQSAQSCARSRGGQFPAGRSKTRFNPSPPQIEARHLARPLHIAQASSQTSTGARSGPQASNGRSRSVEELNNPLQIGAKGRQSVRVVDLPGQASLQQYMFLPVEQYFVLDPERIRHLEGPNFVITIPRIEILGAWLEPEVRISVVTETNPPRVFLQANDYSLKGSEGIEAMRLNEKFAMNFATELTWKSPQTAFGSNPNGSARATQPQDGEIIANATLDVWAEVVPPFNFMPREVLQASCNVVMNGTMASGRRTRSTGSSGHYEASPCNSPAPAGADLWQVVERHPVQGTAGTTKQALAIVQRLLGQTYGKWSKDIQYSKQQALRSKPLQ